LKSGRYTGSRGGVLEGTAFQKLTRNWRGRDLSPKGTRMHPVAYLISKVLGVIPQIPSHWECCPRPPEKGREGIGIEVSK